MRVTETFRSIQGEGPMMGRPGVFLRLWGCNLLCPDCDTPYASQNGDSTYDEMPVPDVWMRLVQEFGSSPALRAGNVYVTGGEPMLQATELGSLMLSCPGTYFGIETNGTIFDPTKAVIKSDVHFIVSPKLPSMHPEGLEKYDRQWSQAALHTSRVQFKFVVADEDEYRMVEDFVKREHIPRRKVWIMVKGITAEDQMRDWPGAFSQTVKEHWGFNLTPRLHVLAFGNKRGV